MTRVWRGLGPDSGFGFVFFSSSESDRFRYSRFGFGSVSALEVRIRIDLGTAGFGFGSDQPPRVRIRIGLSSEAGSVRIRHPNPGLYRGLILTRHAKRPSRFSPCYAHIEGTNTARGGAPATSGQVLRGRTEKTRSLDFMQPGRYLAEVKIGQVLSPPASNRNHHGKLTGA